MHELHRAERIKKYLETQGVSNPVTIKIAHLKTTQIMLEEVEECLDIVLKNSPLEGSKIKFFPSDTILKCEVCGNKHVVERDKIPMNCINCGSDKLSLDDIDELKILSYE